MYLVNPMRVFLLAILLACHLLTTAQAEEIIIKFKDSSNLNSAAAHLNTAVSQLSAWGAVSSDKPKRLSGNAYLFELNADISKMNLTDVIKELQANDSIDYVQPNSRLVAMQIPNDVRFNEQWHYFEPKGGLNLTTAWDISIGSEDTVIAIVDTGILPHADLVNKLLPGFDFITDPFTANDGDGRDNDPTDPGDFILPGECGNNSPSSTINSTWHGTHVAGTAAASTNNGQGVAGVSWNSRILPVRVLGKCGGRISDIIDAIRWSAGIPVPGALTNQNPADVINLSLGGQQVCSPAMQDAINDATDAGSIVVVAAGNSDTNALGFEPASCDQVITVAATNREGDKTFYSNFASIIDISAPGGDTRASLGNGILSTLNNGSTSPNEDSFGFFQGTSMAAPHISGLVALMRSINQSIRYEQAEQILKLTAKPLTNTTSPECQEGLCGTGIADAFKSLEVIKENNLPAIEDIFKNTNNSPIPDASTQQGLISPLSVTKIGDSGTIEINVKIEHENTGDLAIFIITPKEVLGTLKLPSGVPGNALDETFLINANNIRSEGVWRLMVIDTVLRANNNNNQLNSWQIDFSPAPAPNPLQNIFSIN